MQRKMNAENAHSLEGLQRIDTYWKRKHALLGYLVTSMCSPPDWKMVHHAMKLYFDIVLAPLGLDCTVEEYDYYVEVRDVEDTDVSYGIEETDVDVTSDDLPFESMLPVPNLDKQDILQSVDMFLTRKYANARLEDHAQFWASQFVVDMRKIPDHLVYPCRSQRYQVIKTIVIRGQDNDSGAHRLHDTFLATRPRPRVLHTLNLIYIKPDQHFATCAEFEKYVCDQFDMAQCALSLRVDCDLQYVISEHSFPAKHLVQHNLIRMLPSAFMGREVYATLKRVEKYILRGFSW
jgi:hypothetical protein